MAFYDQQTYATLVELNAKYIHNLCYMAPESMAAFYSKRNPVVLMAKMAQLAPTKDIMNQFISLAQAAARIPINDMFNEWWVPMCSKYLSGVLGENDAAWKQACIDIWSDADMVEQDVPLSA